MTDNSEATRRWAIRIIVYVMLVASAGAAFLLNDWLWRTAREGHLPVWAALAPVVMFTAFVIVYLFDRWLLVRRRHYPAVRAFFQVGLAVVFLAMLWPRQASEWRRTQEQPQAVDGGPRRLLGFGDPEVRAAGCELVGFRGERDLLGPVETLAGSDSSDKVRMACRVAADKLRAGALP